jgi:carboxymethylenebutenolidase
MGDWVQVQADDGHVCRAYRATPPAAIKGSVVVIQEVFGVSAHIRQVCDGFAAAGYAAIAPALFDRIRPGVELGYDEAGIAEGRALVADLGWEAPLRDVDAAAKHLRGDGRVGVAGYCWGGSVAWLAGGGLDVACVAAYYGRHIVEFTGEQPRCPGIMHFGAADPLIPQETVDRVRAAWPKTPVFIYDGAGHGFNCDQRADYRPAAAALALQRTLALFTLYLS